MMEIIALVIVCTLAAISCVCFGVAAHKGQQIVDIETKKQQILSKMNNLVDNYNDKIKKEES